MTKNSQIVISSSIDEGTLKKLEKVCEKEDRSIAFIIRKALQEYLNKN
jgi:predicted transcriptional regulator